MRIHVLSDLHHEHLRHLARRQGTRHIPPPWTGEIPPAGADVVVLAGDIDNGTAGLLWAHEQSQRLGVPVVYVAGNHEFYGEDRLRLLEQLRGEAVRRGVYFLEDTAVTIGGVRFLGATLWTDYAAYPLLPVKLVLREIGRVLTDHRVIREGDRPFLPADALKLHEGTRRFLRAALRDPFAGATVIVTHHGPSPRCQHPGIPFGCMSAAFHSDLEELMRCGVHTWIYGHTHANLDTTVGTTRLLSNQAGYPREEVPGFLPHLVLEIPTTARALAHDD
jgi:predicted phosphodiesterase